MPANRSRTDRWRDCLWQVYERAGALEVSVSSADGKGPDLVWRIRILHLSDTEIHVEHPSAAGQTIAIEPGVRLVAAMSIGQNRWMFHTHALPGSAPAAGSRSRPAPLRLAMPTTVERCMRRNFYRISTVELSLPKVECWALLDPASALAAEVANRAQILDRATDWPAHRDRRLGASPVENAIDPSAPTIDTSSPAEPIILPDVGPKFHAHLMNLGGGGAGLLINRSDAAALDRSRFFWLRIDLTPQIPLPLGITGRLAHTHIDSCQNFYVGLAFEWAFNAPHRDFVVDQISRYFAAIQHRQQAAA